MESVNLPDEIISQIMSSSLDLKSIIKCMVVCKHWHNLISDLVSNNPLVAKPDVQFLHYDHAPLRFGALDEDTHHIAWMKTLKFPSPADWGTWPRSPRSPRVKSTCNGLVCFLGPYSKDIYICNPILGEYEFFPNPKHVQSDYISQYDLGFCPSSNEYKLTTFTSHTLEICTLGNPIRWRSVPFDVEELRNKRTNAICLSGVFHWLLKTRSILTFDLTKEVFGSIPLPSLEDGKEIYQLACMDNCLVVTAGDRLPSGLDIWARKEDKSSGESGWTKNWVIGAAQSWQQKEIYSRFVFQQLTPQKLSSDGRIIMPTSGRLPTTCLYRSLCSYDPRNKLVTLHYIRRELLAYYTPTFVSPKKLMRKTDG